MKAREEKVNKARLSSVHMNERASERQRERENGRRWYKTLEIIRKRRGIEVKCWSLHHHSFPFHVSSSSDLTHLLHSTCRFNLPSFYLDLYSLARLSSVCDSEELNGFRSNTSCERPSAYLVARKVLKISNVLVSVSLWIHYIVCFVHISSLIFSFNFNSPFWCFIVINALSATNETIW